jgi:hypothetical protein
MKTQMQLVREALSRLDAMKSSDLQMMLESAGLSEIEPKHVFSTTMSFSQDSKSVVSNFSFMTSSTTSSMSMCLVF